MKAGSLRVRGGWGQWWSVPGSRWGMLVGGRWGGKLRGLRGALGLCLGVHHLRGRGGAYADQWGGCGLELSGGQALGGSETRDVSVHRGGFRKARQTNRCPYVWPTTKHSRGLRKTKQQKQIERAQCETIAHCIRGRRMDVQWGRRCSAWST